MYNRDHFDEFRSETFTTVKILGALGNIVGTSFLRKNPSSLFKRIRKFSLR
jgi:hypothetical protein